MDRRILEKIAAIACAGCLAIGVMSGVVFARDEAEIPQEVPAPEATFVVLDFASEEADEATAEITDNRNTVPFVVNGEQICTSVLVNGVPHVGVADFCRALGAEDVSFEAREGNSWFSCNGRYFYLDDGVQVMGGEVWLPVEMLAECLGVTAIWDQVEWIITVDAEGYELLESGADRYDETDVYWLSHVIYAEAGNQPLEGQIGVANVVLNRMVDEAFAEQDSVYDVIFAKNQFEVVINGMIYMEPAEDAVIAAKLALEGFDMVSGATYFATYDFGEGYECVLWLGDHCFMTAA